MIATLGHGMVSGVLGLLMMQVLCRSGYEVQDKQMIVESDASLYYVVRESKNSATKSPLLILLHGHAGNENDLLSLGAKIPENWTVISVRAPYKLTENSYRWYDVSMVNGKIAVNILQMEESRKKLLRLVAEVSKKYGTDGQKVIVAGFSQGANMAQASALAEPKVFMGFGVFSGRYVDEFTPYISTPATFTGTKAFIAHGTDDKLLPKTYSEENISRLKALGIHITYCEDSGGHTISLKQWKEFSKWLLYFV